MQAKEKIGLSTAPAKKRKRGYSVKKRDKTLTGIRRGLPKDV